MKRLNADTLNAFVRDAETAVLMFGAPQGEATMDQAIEIADAWSERRENARFGYVDAFQHVQSARAFSVRVLPTTLVLRDGEEVARFEGRCASARIVAAIRAAGVRYAAA